MEYEEVVAKVKTREKLYEYEIKNLVHHTNQIDRFYGEVSSWSRQTTFIIKLDNDLYAIEWEHGFCCQKDTYPNQPYKVKKSRKSCYKN